MRLQENLLLSGTGEADIHTITIPPTLPQAPGADPARLTVALAESLCLRAAIKPATFPFKLWAAYKLVLLTKTRRGGAAGGDAGGAAATGAAGQRQG
jgi:hypothetical protein